MNNHSACVNHRAKKAKLPCERCGNFVCEQCPAFGDLHGCESCIVEILIDSQVFRRLSRSTPLFAAFTSFIVALILFLIFYLGTPFGRKLNVEFIVMANLLFMPLGWICSRGAIGNVKGALTLNEGNIVLPDQQKLLCHLPPSLFLSFIIGLTFFTVTVGFGGNSEPIASTALLFIYCAICLIFSGVMTVNRFQSFPLKKADDGALEQSDSK